MSKTKPVFDPSQPYTSVDKPAFDPNQPFQETDTGLPDINEPTDVRPADNAFNAGLNAIPGFGAAKQVEEALNSTPTGKKIGGVVSQGAAMGTGAAVAEAPLAEAALAGGPAAVIPAIGLSMATAGAGNVAGGLINDLHDDPKGAMDALSVLFDPAGANLANLLRTDPERAMQIAKDKFGKRFSEGAIGQLLSLGLQSLVPSPGGILDVGSKAIPGVEEELRNAGYTPDAAQFTKSRVAQVAKSVANKGMLSAETMNAAAAKNAKIAAGNMDTLTSDLANGLKDKLAPSEIADIISSSKGGLADPLQKELEHSMYSRLDDMLNEATDNNALIKGKPPVSGVPVPLQPVKEAAGNLNFIDKTGQIGAITRGLNDEGRYVTFGDAHDIRSSLNDVIRNSTDAKEIRAATTLSQALDGSMEQAAKSAGNDIYKQWREADAFTRAGKETFSNDLVSKLFIQDGSQAERVGRSLMSNGNTSQIKALNNVFDRIDYLSTSDPVSFQKVLGNADANTRQLVLRAQKEGVSVGEFLRNRLKAGTLQDLLSPYTKVDPNTETGYSINYGALAQELNPKTNPEGYEKLRAIFGGNGVSRLQTTVNLAERATSTNPAAFDRAIYWGERIAGGLTGGALGAVVEHPLAGAVAGEGLGMFGIPKLASYLLTDPTASKYFISGVDMLSKSGGTAAIKTGMDLIVKAATAYADTYLQGRK